MAHCIYCRKPLTGTEPPEHVIPQSFGTFHPNLTIFCICADCNHFFGRTLEWSMRNSSTEGVLRFSYGLATGGKIGGVGTDGIEFRIAESPDWIGARVVLKINKKGEAYIDLLPQVGARKTATDEWEWYLEKDVNAEFAAKYPKGSEFRIVGCGGDFQRIQERLISVCPMFQPKETMSPPIGTDGKVGVRYINDFVLSTRRLLAKVAFNYLAWVRDGEFTLRPEFDAVRSFIRDGTEPSEGIVYFNSRPILANERLTGTQVTEGHIVTVEAMPEQRRIESRLSLFNSLKYRIILSAEHQGLWFAKGHHFDIHTREVSDLASQATFIVSPGVSGSSSEAF
jgi:hypothetical protein